jgi:hypothetical protein
MKPMFRGGSFHRCRSASEGCAQLCLLTVKPGTSSLLLSRTSTGSMPSLPDLPTELLMEIVKYYPELYLDIDTVIRGVPSEQLDGNDVLRALSQTSHVLRGIFLPLLWARVHSCFTARNRPKRKIRTRALEHRMIGIRKTPYVVPHIRYARSTLVFLSQQI